MSFYCVPQVIGLTRGTAGPNKNTGRQSTHRMNGLSAALEAAEERASKSETLDRAFSSLNEYWSACGSNSGYDVWAGMTNEADEYRVSVKCKDGVVRERKLRSDALIGVATIVKPPEEVTRDWSVEKRDKFFDDARAVLAEIDPDIYRPEAMRFTARHRDEFGEHEHIMTQAEGLDGKYCGSRVTKVGWLQDMSKQFCKKMRGRGWDIDMPEFTDWEKFHADDDYAAEVTKKHKKQGKSVNEYVREKTKATLEDAVRLQQSAQEANSSAQVALEAIENEKQRASEARIRAEKDEAEAKALKARAEKEVEEFRAAAQAEIDEEREKLEAEKQEVRDVYATVKKQRENLHETVDTAVKRRDTAARRDGSRAGSDTSRAKRERDLPDVPL